jgi:hypothetical protein
MQSGIGRISASKNTRMCCNMMVHVCCFVTKGAVIKGR